MSQYSSSSAPLDNFYWPIVSPNELLASDLPAREHVLRHFNDNPARAQPPATDAWREKHDRAKVFRDLRDGTLDHRQREAYRAQWGLGAAQAASSLDLTHHELHLEAAGVLTELLRDGSLAELAALKVGRSAVWDALDEEVPDGEEGRSEGGAASAAAQKAYVATVQLCDALVLHPTLREVTLAGVELPLRALRGSAEETMALDLSDCHLQTVHGLCVAAGLRMNHVLTSLDVRFNPGLGAAAHAALAEAFLNGAALSLATLNGVAVDAGRTSLSLAGRGDVPRYELLWLARRLGSVDRQGRLRELNLAGCGLGVDAAQVVATMLPSLCRTIDLVDLSHNSLCGVHRDRYDTWHGTEDPSGFAAILASLKGRTVKQLKLNGCALGASGALALAAALKGPGNGGEPLRVLSVEVRSGHMEVDGLAALLAAVGEDLGVRGGSLALDQPSLDQPSLDFTQASHAASLAASAAAEAPPDGPPCCPIVCLDTRGNAVNKLAEARLATLMERVFEAGWLECFNGIDFRPFAHLRLAPTSRAAGEEWWHTGAAAHAADAHALLHHTHPNASLRMVSASGRAVVAAPVEDRGLLEGRARPSPHALPQVQEEPLASLVTTKTARGGVLFTQKPAPATTGAKAAKAELNLAGRAWAEEMPTPAKASSTMTSSYAKERVTGGVAHLGLGIHETCFACRMALRLRLTQLVLADTRLVGLTKAGAGLLGAAESDRALALQPLGAVCALVRDSAYLRTLDLSGNALGDAGDAAVQSVAHALSMSVSLKALNLARNRLSPQHLGHLASALSNNNCLESLDLQTNQLGAYNAIQAPPLPPRTAAGDEFSEPPDAHRQQGPRTEGGRRRPLPRVPSKLNAALLTTGGHPLGRSGYGLTGARSAHDGGGSRGSSVYSQKSLASGSKSLSSSRRSVGDRSLASKPLASNARAVSATLARFMATLVDDNRSLTRLDLRENGWSLDEKELFADALDAPRDPAFTYLRLS